jgi:hypothetical protein
VQHEETGGTAFTFTSTPTLAVTLPDGTLLSPAPTVTVTPGISALVQTLSAVVPFATGGAYRLAWSMHVGSDNPIIRTEDYFAFWTDVPALVRRRLLRDAATLLSSDIEAEAVLTVRRLLTVWICLVSYNALSGNDRGFFDEALALIMAARMADYLPTLATGAVIQQKEMDEEVSYSDLDRNRKRRSQAEVWAEEAAAALGQIACIKASRAASSFQPFRVSGPTRTAIAAGCPETLLTSVLRLLSDDFCLDSEDIGVLR